MERYDPSEFAILGVNTDGDPEEFLRLQDELDVAFPSLFTGSVEAQVVRTWGVRSFPTLFVLDRELRLRGKNVRGQELTELLDELVAR